MIFLIEGKALGAKKKKVDFSNNLTANPGDRSCLPTVFQGLADETPKQRLEKTYGSSEKSSEKERHSQGH